MGTLIEAGIVVEKPGTIVVSDATGNVNIPVALGDTWYDTRSILAWLKAELEATLGSVWTIQIVAGRVTIETDTYPFSWAWGTATGLRDFLGFAGDVVGKAVPWIAPAALHGYLSLTRDAIEWPIDYSGKYAATTAHDVYADGKSEAASVPGGIQRAARVVLDLDNPTGTYAEHADYEGWVDDIQDGRPFTIWPEDSEPSFWGMLDPRVKAIEIKPTHPPSLSVWRTSFDMAIMGVEGE
jgi:hypothetical protein